MIRKIIQIDEEKCNGCGACANACHEGAIQMIDGKARLIRDDYCDGLGDCLPACPTDAIHFIEREAAAYDDDAVKEHLKKKAATRLKDTWMQKKLINMTLLPKNLPTKRNHLLSQAVRDSASAPSCTVMKNQLPLLIMERLR